MSNTVINSSQGTAAVITKLVGYNLLLCRCLLDAIVFLN